jgi:hypothetical protein
MKTATALLCFFASLVVIYFVVKTFGMEKFQPEFLDKRNLEATLANQHSSYNQTTNHIQPAPYETAPIPGKETVFQVNQFKSYMT